MLQKINLRILVPPVIFLSLLLLLSLWDTEGFIVRLEFVKSWILSYFDWLFNVTVFSFLALIITIYFSPAGKIKIGGEKALPLFSKSKWFSVIICSTIATGILFWGTAEPLFHVMHSPVSGIQSGDQASITAMSALYMHWTLSPYALYTAMSLIFALVYYNYNLPFRVSSIVKPLKIFRSNISADFIDIICLVALVGGMAAALGAGVLTISGGLEQHLGLEQNSTLWGIIIAMISTAFIFSAASGLQKGIKWLSQINIALFIVLILFFALNMVNTTSIGYSLLGLKEYFIHFIPRSLGLGDVDRAWEQEWMSFYWANWIAWAPIAALFLGRIGVGYTAREFIRMNLIYTSIFSAIWISIFGGVALSFDQSHDGFLTQLLIDGGPQDVIFHLLGQLPGGSIVSLGFLGIVFLSFVTAADSNTSAMSGLSSNEINPDNPEAPLFVKIIWGLFISVLSWIMITYSGIDGIKLISILGGFPALFLCLAVFYSFWKLLILK